MKVGDLVVHHYLSETTVGIILDMRLSKDCPDADYLNPHGMAVLAWMPDITPYEWYHECELEIVNEGR